MSGPAENVPVAGSKISVEPTAEPATDPPATSTCPLDNRVPVCPDRAAIGGEYVPWLLREMKEYEDVSDTRILDMLTLHVYPQGGEVDNGGSDVSAATQQKRNRSTRSLWDVNYVDESWIGQEVKLIPRMRDWVATSYPGTQLGLTEYDWGADNHINTQEAQPVLRKGPC